MTDVTNRVILVFKHPKSKKEDPILVGLTIPQVLAYGPPQTKKGKPWIFVSTELVH
jgi:hypothetical protein